MSGQRRRRRGGGGACPVSAATVGGCGASGSGSSSTGTPPRVQISSLSTFISLAGLANCFIALIQLDVDIQMLAEPLIAAKRAGMRRLVALLLISALAVVPTACRQEPQGAVRAIVSGGEPRLRDPYLGPLDAPDAVLLQNVAQGLVRFDAAGNV